MRVRNRRGVSEVVGVLLMLAVVVSLGVLIFSFASGSMRSFSQTYAVAMQNERAYAAQKFLVEQASFTFAASLAPDGSSQNELGGASGSIAATLTTASSNDVIAAFVSPADTDLMTPPSVSGISGGGLTWQHRVTAPTQSYTGSYYVPVTVTNSQTTATPNPFQQMITWNPSTFSAHEASDLGNVRLCADSVCTTTLDAWLESCTGSCTPSATSATAWVELTSSIPAIGGTLTIYMVFLATSTEFDGVYWGEAPQLSATYAQYDNGANVFSAYFDGNTPTSDFSVYTGLSVAKATGVTGPGGATINAIDISGTSGHHIPSFAFNQALSNTALITETSYALAADTNDGTGVGGLLDSATATGALNGIGAGEGFGGDYFYQGTDVAGTVNEPINGAGAAPAAGAWLYNSLTYTGVSAASWYSQTTTALYGVPAQSAGTGYSGTDTVANSLGAAGTVYMGSIGGSAAVNIEYNFMRARAYPPSGVMPSAALGAGVDPASTYDVEEWYAVAAAPLSAVSITATLSTSDSAETWISLLAFSGGDTASPFDANAALPATAAGTNNVQTSVSTSNANDALLYSCAAFAGTVPGGFTSVFSNAFQYQDEHVGFDQVSVTQSGLAVSCGGTNAYGSEITDALVSAYSGADLFVRNVGTVPATLVAVYITDTTSGTFISQATMSTTVNVGSFVDIAPSSLSFTPNHGDTYSFTVTSSTGDSVLYSKEVT